MKKKSVFLDRDGTLILDKGYVGKIKDVELISDVPKALKKLKELGFLLIVISNQSGVRRGYFTQKEVEDVNHRINQLLQPEGVQVERFYICPHLPDEGCCCRKPSTSMVMAAAKFYDIDLSSSYLVGDKSIDIQTGLAAGCKTVWVKTSEHVLDKGVKPDFKAKNLLEASNWIEKEVKQ